jgi:hypothetical protein
MFYRKRARIVVPTEGMRTGVEGPCCFVHSTAILKMLWFTQIETPT